MTAPPAGLLDRTLGRLALAAVARPWPALAAVAALTLAAVPGLERLTLRTDGHALMPPDDPAIAADAEIRARFGLRDPVAVVVSTSHPDGVFNPATLARVAALHRVLADLPGVGPEHVTSLASEKRDKVYPGTLEFRPFLDPLPSTPAELAELREDLAAAGLFEGTLVALDGRATTILAGVPVAAGDAVAGERHEVFERIWRALEGEPCLDRDPPRLIRSLADVARPRPAARDEAACGGDRVTVVGAPVAEALLGSHVLEDLGVLLPLALATIAAVFWLACRRGWAVALALAEVGACQLFTFGLMGWLGVPVYLSTAVLPVILTTVGLADEIHLLWRYQGLLAEGVGPHPEAVRRTMLQMLRPVILATLTTALALLSFRSSAIPPVQSFGLFAAAGVIYCQLYSLVALPAALALLGPERLRRPVRRRAEAPFGRPAGRLLPWLSPRGRRVALAAIAGLTLAAVAGLPALSVQDSWIDGFAPGSAFRRATEEVDRRFFGTHLLLVEVSFPEAAPADAVSEPGERARSGPLLAAGNLPLLAELEELARTLPGVGGALGPHRQLAAVHYLWQARREGMRKVPEEPDSQELLLDRFDQALGPGRRREIVDDTVSRGVVTLFLRGANFRDTAALIRRLEAWAGERLAPHGGRIAFAGDVAVSQAMIPAIVRTQVTSLGLALVGAFAVVALVYRSPRTGLLAVLPAVGAVLWVFGLMGWSGIPLGVATSMFCAVTLGIGVDYGIHFLERVRWRRAEGTAAPVDAAVREVGPAIGIDALAIGLGFGILGFSRVPPNARLGLLVALALAAAAILTLVGLAAALARRDDPA